MGQYGKSLDRRVLTRGPEIGFCAICGSYEKLTRDHVPPKGCNNAADVVIRMFGRGHDQQSPSYSQGGTHFRTLCENCNTNLLGSKFDPDLVKLSNEVTSAALSSRWMPSHLRSEVVITCRPQRIARAVVGHSLAAHAIDECKNGLHRAPIPTGLRSFFLNSSAPMPEEMEIYYWVYPSRRQVALKGYALSTFGAKGAIVIGNILKFLPLAFWIIWERPPAFFVNARQLVTKKTSSIDDRAELRVDVRNIPMLGFPESPQDHEFAMYRDDQTSVSVPKDAEPKKY